MSRLALSREKWQTTRRAITLVEVICAIAMTLLLAIVVFAKWRESDPTNQFKEMMLDAEIEIEMKPGIKERFKLAKLSYDVRKTDSTITPFVADAEVEVVDSREVSPPRKPVAASQVGADLAKQMNDLGATVTDTGRRAYNLKYAFQERRWVLKDVKASKIMLNGRQEPTLMPDVLKMLFMQ